MPDRFSTQRRTLFALAILAFAPVTLAQMTLQSTRIEAHLRYEAGTDASHLSYIASLPSDSLFFRGASPPPGQAAQRVGIVPDFTPPAGAIGDTLFLPAELRAYQSVEGFNATRVDAAIADGLPFHRAEARTEWSISAQVSNLIPHSQVRVFLDYLLFPGEAGLTAFGGFTGEAGFRAAISVEDVQIDESLATLRSGPGLALPTLATSGDFLQPGVSLTTELRNGLSHNVIRTEPVFGTADLGLFQNGDFVNVKYVLEAWLEIPGFEVGGFAAIGDPFALSSDPAAYLASQLPGIDVRGMVLTEQPVPVPLPGGFGLLFGAVGVMGAALRRRVMQAWEPAPAHGHTGSRSSR